MHIAPPRGRTRDIATTNDVGVLVRRFYRRAIPDELLGPVFEEFGVDWATHIPKLEAYWARAVLGRPGYAGNTIGAHVEVARAIPFGDRHIERWLELWSETVDDVFAGPNAERAKQRAAEVGRSLQVVLARLH